MHKIQLHVILMRFSSEYIDQWSVVAFGSAKHSQGHMQTPQSVTVDWSYFIQPPFKDLIVRDATNVF